MPGARNPDNPENGPGDPGDPGGVPRALVGAVAVIGIQALALLVLMVFVLTDVVTGHPHSLAGALFGAVWAAVGALVLGVCGRAMLRLQVAARTPVIVIELLALPVGYSLAFPSHRPEYGVPLLLSALAVLYLLFTPAARAALDRER